MVRLPNSSKEYVGVDLTLIDGVEFDDVTVELAIVASGTAVDSDDWKTAIADPDVAGRVRLLVGPGTTFGALTAGTYNVWTRIAAGAEAPVRKAGSLRVTATT
jgi:hypothetical protein